MSVRRTMRKVELKLAEYKVIVAACEWAAFQPDRTHRPSDADDAAAFDLAEMVREYEQAVRELEKLEELEP